jgi:hypothetical protein
MFTDIEGRLSNGQSLRQLRIPDIQFFRSREIAASFGKRGEGVRLQRSPDSHPSGSHSRLWDRGLRPTSVLRITHLVHLLIQWISARRNRSVKPGERPA